MLFRINDTITKAASKYPDTEFRAYVAQPYTRYGTSSGTHIKFEENDRLKNKSGWNKNTSVFIVSLFLNSFLINNKNTKNILQINFKV